MKLWFKDLFVKKMPGFDDRGFDLQNCDADMNLVYGRNAAGKSTAARAIQSLLWPATADKGDQVTGRFQYEDKEYTAELKSDKAQYDIKGQLVDSPVNCDAEFCKCYYLLLKDLATDEQADLARKIKTQMAGGYDLQKIADELNLKEKPPTAKITEKQALDKAGKTLEDARKSLQENVNAANRLGDLQAELNEADDASKREEILEAAIDYAQNRDTLADKQAAVDSFDPRIQKLQGEEREKIDELNEELKTQNARLDEAIANIERCSNDIEQTNLPDGGVPDGVLNTLDERARSLITKQERINTLQTEYKEADAAVSESRKYIGDDVTDEQLEQITETGNWSQQSEAARKAQECRANVKALGLFGSWLESKKPDTTSKAASVASLNTGISRLHDWLDKPVQRSGFPIWIFIASVAISVILAISDQAVLAALFMIMTGVIGVFAILRVRVDSKSPHNEYQSSGLPQPDAWMSKSVTVLLETLREQLRLAEYDRDLQAKLLENKSALDKAEEEKAAIDQQIEKLRENLGAAPGADEAGLVLLAEAIKNWRDARAEQRKAEAALQTAKNDYSVLIDEINAEAKPYTNETCTDSESANGLIKDLKDRATKYRDAARDLKHSEQDKANATEKIQQIESKIDELFNNIGVQKDDLQTLSQLLELLGDYRSSSKERDKAHTNAETSAKKLRNLCGSYPGQLSALEIGDWSANEDTEAAIEHIMSLHIDQLETEKGNQHSVASRHGEIQEEITQIKTLIDQDKKSHKLEEALAQVMDARSDLRRHRDDTYASMVGRALVNYVEEKSREDDPEVLKRANYYLKKVTDNRYELLFADGRFRVRDEAEKVTREVNELSDGTRVQLLLCVRLAFVEHLEDGKNIKLPLLFDETLASTDDHRAPLVARAIAEICREGRQVFYFTAQKDEVEKMKNAVPEGSNIKVKEINFDAVVGSAK